MNQAAAITLLLNLLLLPHFTAWAADRPVAADLTVTTNEGVSVEITLQATGDPQGYKVSVPAHGTLVRIRTGVFLYTPELDFVGSDHFTYTAANRYGISLPASVEITVTEVTPIWLLDQLPVDSDATITINGTQIVVKRPSDDCVENESGISLAGPDAAGNEYVIWGAHAAGAANCAAPVTQNLSATNIGTGATHVIYAGISTGSVPVVIANDVFQGFVVSTLVSERGNNGVTGTVMFIDVRDGTAEVNTYDPFGPNTASDTPAALVYVDNEHFQIAVGSVNSPRSCNNTDRDTSGCGAFAHLNENGSLLGRLNSDSTPRMRNWMSGAVVVNTTEPENPQAVIGTSVGHDGTDDWNAAGYPCQIVGIDLNLDDPSNLFVTGSYDPGSAGCSAATATSGGGVPLDSAVAPEVPLGIWARLYGDPDDTDGVATGAVYQLNDDLSLKCEGHYELINSDNSAVDTFYSGIVLDATGNAYFVGIRKAEDGRRVRSLMKANEADCAITILADFSGMSKISAPTYALRDDGVEVILVSYGGDLYIINAATGESEDTLALNTTSENTISGTMVTANSLVTLSGDNTLTINRFPLNGHSYSYGASPWPRYRGDNQATAQYTTRPAFSSPAPASFSTPPAFTPPAVTVTAEATQYDLTYCEIEGEELKLDLYRPAGTGPFPVGVFVHGGGWVSGDKGDWIKYQNSAREHGFAIAALNYRFAGAAKPSGGTVQLIDMVQDLKCGVRYLRANATPLNLDSNAIAGFGASAGGHLIGLVATDIDGEFGIGSYTELFVDYSSQLQSVAILYGPTDFTQEFDGLTVGALEKLLGSRDPDDATRQWASPAYQTSAQTPPVFMAYGEEDDVVPIEQGYALRDALIAAGVDYEFIAVANATHGFVAVGSDPISPSLGEIFDAFWEWFAR